MEPEASCPRRHGPTRRCIRIAALIGGATLSWSAGTARAADVSWSAAAAFGSPMYGLACPAASQCTGVGASSSNPGQSLGSEETFDPAAPGSPVHTIVEPELTTVEGVRCPSAHQCTAVVSGEEVTFDPTSPGTPSPVTIDSNDDYADMEAIACRSVTQCVTVGNAGQIQVGSGDNTQEVLVTGQEETFDPTSPGPARATTPIDPGYFLAAVECPSATECVAVGEAGQEVVFDPSAPAASAVVATLGSLGLYDLACPSASQCTALVGVGQEVTFNPTSPGTPAPVSIDPGLVNDATQGGFVSGLACPSTTECVAVDTMGRSVEGDPTGSAAWTVQAVVPTADPDTNLGVLAAVACASTSECVASDYAGNEFTATIGGSASPTPAAATAPSVAGSTAQGQTLTESHGAWTNAPTAYGYQWYDCDGSGNACTGIAGATGPTYTLGGGDVGHTIRVQETASNASGAGPPATSAQSAVVTGPPPPTPPVNSSPPTVSGAVEVGRSVGCFSRWTGSPPITFAYQWLRDAVPVTGATSSTYAIVAADAGHGLACRVTARNAAGTATATSASVLLPIIATDRASTSRATVSGTIAGVTATCTGSNAAGCKLVLTLSAAATTRGGRLVALSAGAGATTAHARLALGSTTVRLAAGQRRAIHVKLNATGRRLLVRRSRLPTTLRITTTGRGGSRHSLSDQKLTFSA